MVFDVFLEVIECNKREKGGFSCKVRSQKVVKLSSGVEILPDIVSVSSETELPVGIRLKATLQFGSYSDRIWAKCISFKTPTK